MSKSIPQKRQALHFTTFVKLTIWPLIVLLACCMALSLKLYFDIGKKTENLTDETVNSLLLSQRTAVNLEGLRFSLDIIANASEAERARDAYVNAWAMLSESALDRHDDTRLVVKQVLESLQQTWQERKALDADFARAQKVSAQFGKNLFDLYSQSSGLPRLAELPKTRLFRAKEITDQLRLFGQTAAEIRAACAQMHSDADSRLSSISSESCPNLLQTSATLEAALQEAQRSLERFDTAVSLMNDDMARLQHIFSAREARELLSEISAINKTSASFVPVIIAFILITVLTLFSISLWFNTLVEPLREVMQAMKDFLDRGVMPPKNITSHVTELNQMIEWLMLFCSMTASEQHKNQVIAEQYKTLIKESQRDPLTGVYNRMAFEEIASRKAPLPPMCAVAMIDIDHFKRINDTRGHLFGDSILSAVGETLRRNLDKQDLIYRYGGDEFCVVISGITEESLATVAQHLLAKLGTISTKTAQISNYLPEGDGLSATIGLSTITTPNDHKDILKLIEEADHALYRAKRAGRGRCASALKENEA
ncbi:GGDEF domain-containing protein [Sutterella wadsworthensis]|uniref:GGDEF domain-containing protein n=2 Tax=Sutterella wadsworthensis TaxID=40545 RepID=UPI0013F5A5AA|nr:GGDEF domain-containing protein [Sutterella wadsworthensis]